MTKTMYVTWYAKPGSILSIGKGEYTVVGNDGANNLAIDDDGGKLKE